MKEKLDGWMLSSGRMAIQIDDDTVWLVDEDSVHPLNGPAGRLAILLDKTRTDTELTALSEGITEASKLLERLERAGLIERSGRPRQVRLNATGLHFEGSLEWKALTRIGVEPIRHLLESSGVELVEGAGRLLVTTDDYLSPAVLDIARSEKRSWMLARPVGRTLFIGPVFSPGKTCWFCMAHWLRTRRWNQTSRSGWGDDKCPGQPAVAASPSTTASAAGLLATTVLRWLSGSRDLEGEFQCVQLIDGRESRYPLIPRAGCHCSKQVSVPFSVWTNPLTGLVFNFQRAPNPVGGIWHARAEHFRPLPQAGARPLLRPGTVYGAGSSSDEAETRCIAEGLERYSSIWQGDEELLCASKDQLENTIDPEQITLFSEKQYRDRLDWNQKYAALFHVAERLETKEPIEWAKAKALSDGTIWHVPAACVYLWHNTPAGINFGIADSNGCAAGRTQEEAILGGLLELIERDAVAIWWYNRLQRPQVDWAAFSDPWILLAVEAMIHTGRRPVLLDLTHDFGIPVYAAVAAKADGSQPYAGCAAHLDARTAARKALTELVQNWFWSSLNSGEEAQYAWVEQTNNHTNQFLLPKGTSQPGASFNDSTDKAIEQCVSRLAAGGVSAFWLDLTRKEIGLPVVRAIAPGLRHCWMRFAPGRLYDVPVRMGWLESPLQEEAMNPEGCPL